MQNYTVRDKDRSRKTERVINWSDMSVHVSANVYACGKKLTHNYNIYIYIYIYEFHHRQVKIKIVNSL